MIKRIITTLLSPAYVGLYMLIVGIIYLNSGIGVALTSLGLVFIIIGLPLEKEF